MSEDSGFFRGQVGALIRLDTSDDPALLALATKKEIHYQRPSGVVGVWTATLDGTKLTFTTSLVTDLLESGKYFLQAYIEGPSWKIPGERVPMVVGEPIKVVV